VGTIDEERHQVDILVLQSIVSSDYGLGTKLLFFFCFVFFKNMLSQNCFRFMNKTKNFIFLYMTIVSFYFRVSVN